MKLILFISLISFSLNTLACRCFPAKSAKVLANSEAIFEGEVVFSDSGKTLVQVTNILSLSVELDRSYLGHWFIFSGSEAFGSCPENDVTAKIGTQVMFFPTLETYDDYVKTVVATSETINHCGSFNNYFRNGSYRYQEVLDLIQ